MMRYYEDIKSIMYEYYWQEKFCLEKKQIVKSSVWYDATIVINTVICL